MSKHSFSAEPDRRNQTEFGFSVGLGAEYNVDKKNFVNLDFRYNLIDKEKPAWYTDYGLIRVGYGFRF
jgi:opacity protein-like surface antigen